MGFGLGVLILYSRKQRDDSGVGREGKTYLFIIDDDAITLRDINTVRSPQPALPEDTVDPRKGDGFPKVFFSNTDSLADIAGEE